MAPMTQIHLVVIDPGHFHAALLQGDMHPGLSPLAQVYAPFGSDLLDYLTRVERFNRRADRPTSWRFEIHAGPGFLTRLRETDAGGLAVIAGRNRGKIALIEAAIEAGLHVLADKPCIIRSDDLPRLARVLDIATRRGLVVADIMSGRHDVTAILLGALHGDPAVFGEQLPGTADEPGVAMVSVHHLLKQVAGVANPRPAWYFDIDEQGGALVDIATHLVDQAQRTLFPDRAIDHAADIRIDAARHWPTLVSLAQFRQVTGEARWPAVLAPAVVGDQLRYLCNGSLDYRLRDVCIRLEMRWDWEAPAGAGDTHRAVFRGTRARLELRQGGGERRELIVVPQADIGAALAQRLAALQPLYPGIGAENLGHVWRVTIPDGYRLGHDGHFIALMRAVLDQVARPDRRPAWEAANLLAKYAVTTAGLAMAEHSG
jgi:predicted dehydrogenase